MLSWVSTLRWHLAARVDDLCSHSIRASRPSKQTHLSTFLLIDAQVGEDTFDSSLSWLNGTEMRPRVGYLIASGSTVTLGEGKALQGGRSGHGLGAWVQLSTRPVLIHSRRRGFWMPCVTSDTPGGSKEQAGHA